MAKNSFVAEVTFNRCEASLAVAVDTCRAFDRVWHAGHLHKLNSGQIFGPIFSFLSNRQFWKILNGKFSQEYP